MCRIFDGQIRKLKFSEQVSHIKISDVYSEPSQTSKIGTFGH